MALSFAPIKRLKWGFLPVRRIVDEDIDATSDQILDETSRESDQSLKADSHSVDKQSSREELTEEVKRDLEPEYRDEKNRKWWKFFDEYEYRLTKKQRTEHKWFKWFNENDTPEERRLIMKLDVLLTLYSLAAYWVKYLDQTNLNNAYVAGLQEGIGMKGNDLVNTQVMFNVGNIVFQIPFMYILYAAPMNYVLPSLDLCWSILTICLYRVTHVGQLKTLRFFIGAFEAPSYLAYQWLFGSWYKVDEIARRSMVYYFGQYLGVLTSGLLSGAVIRSMDGVNGLDSWQWIFIIDGITSLVVGIIGFYMLPGTPTDCYSIFLSDDDIRVARKRLKDNNTNAKVPVNVAKEFFKISHWKSILSSWQIYVLSLWNIFCWNNNNGTSGSYILWLRSLTNSDGSQRYGPAKLQDYTAMTPGLGVLWLILTCCYADLFHSRWQAIVFSQVFNITGNAILAAWDVPERAKWFAFCLQYFGWAMAPVLYSWQNDICRTDLQQRTIVLVFMNMMGQSSTAWLAVLVWKTVEQPRYLKGFSFTASSGAALVLWTFVVLYFYKRQERSNAAKNGIVLFKSDEESDSKVKEEKTFNESGA